MRSGCNPGRQPISSWAAPSLSRKLHFPAALLVHRPDAPRRQGRRHVYAVVEAAPVLPVVAQSAQLSRLRTTIPPWPRQGRGPPSRRWPGTWPVGMAGRVRTEPPGRRSRSGKRCGTRAVQDVRDVDVLIPAVELLLVVGVLAVAQHQQDAQGRLGRRGAGGRVRMLNSPPLRLNTPTVTG